MNAALLNQINSGKLLKKVPESMKNDRSGVVIGGSSNGRQNGHSLSSSALIFWGFE